MNVAYFWHFIIIFILIYKYCPKQQGLYKINSGNQFMEHLSIKDIHDRLEQLKGWEMLSYGEIAKDFEFDDFKQAMDFVAKVGEEAERQKHFPDIMIRQNRVTITLTTPEANGLTYDDFKLARIIEQLV